MNIEEEFILSVHPIRRKSKLSSRLRKKSGFVIARSEATKQSGVSDEKNEIASLPPVARNDMNLFFRSLLGIEAGRLG